jgi:hypothetical protein
MPAQQPKHQAAPPIFAIMRPPTGAVRAGPLSHIGLHDRSQPFCERPGDRRHHLGTNDLVRWTVPIVEDVQDHFYISVYELDRRQLHCPEIVRSQSLEIDNHEAAPGC